MIHLPVTDALRPASFVVSGLMDTSFRELPRTMSPGPFLGWEKLSGREREILYWVAEGKTDKEIGQVCGISHRTVQRHVQIVLQKMEAHTRTAAAAAVWRSRVGGWREIF